MDVRSSQLIVVLFLVFAVVIVTVAYFGFRDIPWSVAELDLSAEQDEPQSASATAARALVMSRDARSTTTEDSRTRRLRELLGRRTATLQKQTEALGRARAESAALRVELERLKIENERLRQQTEWQLASIVAEVSQNPQVDPNLTSIGLLNDNLFDDVLANGASATAANRASEVESEMATLEWELSQSQSRVMELELSMLRELEASSRASDLIVSIGAPAVPTLIQSLSDTNAEVRRWAATVLGRIGPEAFEALENLRQALRDSDVDVATAARQAIDQIEGRF
jgi:HEAT repeat protein